MESKIDKLSRLVGELGYDRVYVDFRVNTIEMYRVNPYMHRIGAGNTYEEALVNIVTALEKEKANGTNKG